MSTAKNNHQCNWGSRRDCPGCSSACEVCGVKTKYPMVRCEKHLQRSDPWAHDVPASDSPVPDDPKELLRTMRQQADDVWHLPGHQDCARTLTDYANRFERILAFHASTEGARLVRRIERSLKLGLMLGPGYDGASVEEVVQELVTLKTQREATSHE